MKKFLKNIIWRFRHLGYQKTEFGTKLKLKSYMDHLVFKEVFIEKIYDDFIKYSLNQSVDNHEAKRIFDIGGNLGFFTIRCCEIWNQFRVSECLHFVIYEPSENCIGRLKENLKGFDPNIFSFDIRNKLVGKKDGWDWFIEDKDHHLGQCVSEKIQKKGSVIPERLHIIIFPEILNFLISICLNVTSRGAKLNSSKTIVHHYKLLKILLLKHMVKVRKILFVKNWMN